MYSNSKVGKPQLILQDTRDPSYSVIDKIKQQVTDYIPEQEEEAPEIPSFDDVATLWTDTFNSAQKKSMAIELYIIPVVSQTLCNC